MGLFKIGREEVEEALGKAPALRPLLQRFARAVARGRPLPESFTVKGLDYDAQRVLERLLRTMTGRTAEGVVRGNVAASMRDPSVWKDAFAPLLAEQRLASDAESLTNFFAKLLWRDPDGAEMIKSIVQMPEVLRHLQKPENRKDWLALYLGVVDMATHPEQGVRTLSQLGSDWLNDSKALRAGPLRRQLALILSAACELDADDERALFGGFGIVDNPYTSAVTVFAPFIFMLKDGTAYDFTAQMFDAGLACQLPLEVIDRIKNIAWGDPTRLLRTSENAAPFAALVARGIPAVYTEGYPNFAVQRLLGWFKQAGVEVEHWGDCDLDGFRIADLISTRIPVRRVVASKILKNPGKLEGIPLTEKQRSRLTHYRANHTDFRYDDELRLLEECGCWYEQEAFPL